MRLPGARAAHERPRRTGDAHSATGRLRGIGRILRPRLGFARGVAEFERPVRLGMHRLGVHVERRLLLRFERQHDPQQDVCDAQQPPEARVNTTMMIRTMTGSTLK